MQVVEQSIKTSLQKYFGFSSFKGEQQEVIQNLLEGNNTFCYYAYRRR